MFGFSMGGAMAYKYAFSSNPQITAMAIESGFIGNEVKYIRNFPISTCHFHSIDDEIKPNLEHYLTILFKIL